MKGVIANQTQATSFAVVGCTYMCASLFIDISSLSTCVYNKIKMINRCDWNQGLLREDRGSNQVELFSADFTSKSAAKN